eukprot:TRINITY_DN1503_c0_g1_i2.p1 TRINITY_DN1503_c0_g1~~TRINITY_DN1503_c0_g1_i2.p1  ORF type:complete len:305 (+),score=51.23 TRINITY_DN1503_c0_g1_i2:104-916(+)
MAAGFWSRVTGRGVDAEGMLLADLKRATDSKLTHIPKELLVPIVEASRTEEGRQDIMKHLQQCLAETSARSWLRVHAGLVVVEELLKDGCPTLFSETAEGLHFDLVQRLSFIVHFEHTTDRRAQHMVRTKASALRGEVVARLQDAEASALAREQKDSESTCTGAMSLGSGSTTASSTGYAPWKANQKQKTPVDISRFVYVGHREDTSSESEGEKVEPAREAKKGGSRTTAKQRRHQSDDSSDSDGGGHVQRRAAPPPMHAPPPTVDLLDF